MRQRSLLPWLGAILAGPLLATVARGEARLPQVVRASQPGPGPDLDRRLRVAWQRRLDHKLPHGAATGHGGVLLAGPDGTFTLLGADGRQRARTRLRRFNTADRPVAIDRDEWLAVDSGGTLVVLDDRLREVRRRRIGAVQHVDRLPSGLIVAWRRRAAYRIGSDGTALAGARLEADLVGVAEVSGTLLLTLDDGTVWRWGGAVPPRKVAAFDATPTAPPRVVGRRLVLVLDRERLATFDPSTGASRHPTPPAMELRGIIPGGPGRLGQPPVYLVDGRGIVHVAGVAADAATTEDPVPLRIPMTGRHEFHSTRSRSPLVALGPSGLKRLGRAPDRGRVLPATPCARPQSLAPLGASLIVTCDDGAVWSLGPATTKAPRTGRQ